MHSIESMFVSPEFVFLPFAGLCVQFGDWKMYGLGQ